MKNIQEGQILVLAIVVVGLVLINTLLIAGGSQLFFQSSRYSLESEQALNLAEAAVDKALASLNASGGSYSGETETVVGSGSYSVAVTSAGGNTKIIEATGYVPSKDNAKAKRTIKIHASKGAGVAFNYGIQVGEGGLYMSNNSRVNGSVYSNGNISISNGAAITGDAYVAGGVAPTADQENECVPLNCTDYIFGKNVNGQDRLDIAQSFQPSVTNYINKVALRLKKVGNPPNAAVRLLRDNNNKPDKNGVLALGTLSSALVGETYGFVEVAFNSPVTLSAGTTYWMMVDTSANSNNYWVWSGDSLQGYTVGQPKWSANWQAGNPAWNDINLDLDFRTFMGGVATAIEGGTGVTIGGDAHANTLKFLTVSGGAYYQALQNVTAGSYFPGSSDPPTKVMPVSESNINTWKNYAASSGVISGDISSCLPTLAAGKYIGNVYFTNGCQVTVDHPIWITGNLTLSNGAILKLNSSYNDSSGVILVDGKTTLTNNSKLRGSGTTGSFLMLVSMFDSRENNEEAIEVANNGNEGILYAPYGIIEIANNNRLNEITGWRVHLSNGSIVDYDSGLAGTFFSSGPSGAFSLVKGTYQLK